MSISIFIILAWFVCIAYYYRFKTGLGVFLVGLSSMFVIGLFDVWLLYNVDKKLVYTILLLTLGVFTVVVLRLVFKLGNLKLNVSILTSLVVVLVPQICVSGFLYLHDMSRPTMSTTTDRVTTTTSDGASINSAMSNENRAKEDITSLLTIRDNASYQKAKYEMTYSKEIADIYFQSDSWNSYVEYIGKPTITFQTFGVDISDSSKLRYFAVVKSNYTRHNNKTGTSVYMITVEYQNGVLTKFTKRVMR